MLIHYKTDQCGSTSGTKHQQTMGFTTGHCTDSFLPHKLKPRKTRKGDGETDEEGRKKKYCQLCVGIPAIRHEFTLFWNKHCVNQTKLQNYREGNTGDGQATHDAWDRLPVEIRQPLIAAASKCLLGPSRTLREPVQIHLSRKRRTN